MNGTMILLLHGQRKWDLQLVNFSPGTRSNADYTYPEMGNKYVSSDAIMKSILQYERTVNEWFEWIYFTFAFWYRSTTN